MVFILFFFLNLLIHNAYAYNLKQVADKEYMSNSSITSLCQDERGLMWIGTCDGLNIYDGQEIEEFKTRDKEDYLSGNLIDNIVYTGEDIYWIQTYYGLNRLNRKTNTITHYNEFQKLFFMNKDSHGNLFIIQDSNCIYYYHKKEGVFKKINITGIPISDIVNFFIDGNNRMWVVMKGYNRCYDIQQEAASGDITLLPQKTNLIYQTSLIYCFNDEQSLYYIDKEFNFYAFHIPTQKNEFIANEVLWTIECFTVLIDFVFVHINLAGFYYVMSIPWVCHICIVGIVKSLKLDVSRNLYIVPIGIIKFCVIEEFKACIKVFGLVEFPCSV